MNTNKPKAPLLAALDIGSTKVSYVIATASADGKIEIVGVGSAPNTGIRQGVVVNIEATTESIRKAREEAELMSGYQTKEVWVGVSGTHIKSFDSKGMVAIKTKEVTPFDIERVIEAAKAVAVPADRTVLHVLPKEYRVDGQDGIVDPIGMSGVRLEANVHIVTAAQSVLSNTIKCIEKAGLKLAGLCLDPLASAMSVLSEDEKNLGVCVVDMGGGTSNIIYFVNGSVAQSSVIPVGGQHFTHDIAVGLRTPQVAAEILKKKHGCAMATMVADTETVEVEGVGGRNVRVIPRKDLADVIEARAEEVLNFIANDIRTSGLSSMMGSGIVFTGGTSQLEGLVEMGEFIFDIPVRRGFPQHVNGLNEVVKSADYATVVGLILYAYKQTKDQMNFESQGQGDSELGASLEGIAHKVKNFFGDLF